MGNPLRGPDAQGRYRYRDYTIKWTGNPRLGCDLEYIHDDYDGEDATDERLGWAQCMSDCIGAIDELEEEADLTDYQAKCNQPGYWA